MLQRRSSPLLHAARYWYARPLTKPVGQRKGQQEQRSMLVKPRSFTAAGSPAGPWPTACQQQASDQPLSRAEVLSWVPTLQWWEEVACVVASGLACTLVYVLTAPARFSLTYSAGMAILAGIFIWATRSVLLERQYQAKAKLITELGDRDSRFPRLGKLQVHAKAHASDHLVQRLENLLLHAETDHHEQQQQEQPSRQPGPACAEDVMAMHCFHGFGANLYSYSSVQANLARALGGIVTSHDMPGFGLTERPSNTAEYFLTFNGQLGSQLMDYELRRLVKQCAAHLHPPATRPPLPAAAAPASAPAQRPQLQRDLSVRDKLEVVSTAEPPPRSPSPDSELRVSTDLDSCESASLSSGQMTPPHPHHAPAVPPSIPEGSWAPATGDSRLAAPAAAASTEVQLKVKKVLIGHSLGGICAALAALDQPDACAGLVLVAPAILALPDKQTPMAELRPLQLAAHGDRVIPVDSALHGPNSHPIAVEEEDGEEQAAANSGAVVARGTPAAGATAGSRSETGWKPAVLPPGLVRRFVCPKDAGAAFDTAQPQGQRAAGLVPRLVQVATVLAQALVLLAGLLILTAFKPAIVALLRLLVRSRTFWLKGLQQAYYNASQVSDEVVDAYRLPQLVRGWESGMFMFLTARLAATVDLRSLGGRVTGLLSSVEQEVAEDAGLAKRLGQLARQRQTPILIIHGVHDKLVPASNSRRLAAMLPDSELVLVERCGHMPQEEWPRAFVELVREFVQRRGREGVDMKVDVTPLQAH